MTAKPSGRESRHDRSRSPDNAGYRSKLLGRSKSRDSSAAEQTTRKRGPSKSSERKVRPQRNSQSRERLVLRRSRSRSSANSAAEKEQQKEMSEHDRENAPSVSGAPRAGREYMTGDVGGTPAKSQGSSPSSSEKNGMFMHARTIALERARVEEEEKRSKF